MNRSDLEQKFIDGTISLEENDELNRMKQHGYESVDQGLSENNIEDKLRAEKQAEAIKTLKSLSEPIENAGASTEEDDEELEDKEDESSMFRQFIDKFKTPEPENDVDIEATEAPSSTDGMGAAVSAISKGLGKSSSGSLPSTAEAMAYGNSMLREPQTDVIMEFLKKYGKKE